MERRLAAILAADVVGFSRMMAEDETGTFERVVAMRQEVLIRVIGTRNGRVVKLIGDGLLAEFASVVDAVEAAIEIQEAVAKRNDAGDPGLRLDLRIGVNMGDLIIDGDDIYGDGVNIAARLEPLADPGGICISRDVYKHTRGKVSRRFESAGLHRVKNIPEPIAVFRLAKPGGGQSAPGRSRKRLAGLGLAAAIVSIAALVLFLRDEVVSLLDRTGIGTAGVAEAGPSLLVLPFENRGLPDAESYLADGLTDDLITDFSRISGILVIGSSTAFSYRDRDIESREAGRELGVRYVLEGSVRRVGPRLLVNVRLTDAETDRTLWAERLEREASRVFDIEDDIVTATVTELGVDLSLSEQQRIGRLPTTDLEAYDYFLRAEEAARSGFRPRLREALGLYARATSVDPDFARAFAARARVEALIMRRNYDDILAYPVARKQAYAHAGRALEIDPDAALPFAVLSELQTVDSRYQEALRSAQFAVERAPGEAAALLALSFVHTFAGRHEEAITQFEKAHRLNPLLPAYARQIASLSYILSGAPDRAADLLEEVRDTSQGVEDHFNILAAAYAEAGKANEARAVARELKRFAPQSAAELYRILFAHFQRPEDLERIVDAMVRAGVQKWPFGFEPETREPLDADEVAALVDGEVWQGVFEGRGVGLLQISEAGTLAIRFPSMFATGSAYVQGDELCFQIPGLALGRAECGQVFKTGEDAGDDAFPYTYVNAQIVFHFAPGG